MTYTIKKINFITEKPLDDSESEGNNSFYSSFSQNQENISLDDNYLPYCRLYDTKSTLNGELPNNLDLFNNTFKIVPPSPEEYYMNNEDENKKGIQLYHKDKINEKKKNIQFRSYKNGKINRGRIPKKISNKIHKKTAFDNLQRKIQVSFISFIINFSNDVLNFYYGEKKNKKYFKDISHKIKKEINFKSCEKFKKSTIKDILQFDISSKYKKYKNSCPETINDNQELLNEIFNESESKSLNKYFNMKYLELFKYYYNKAKHFKSIKLDGKIITLSSKTKTFYDLLQKNKDVEAKLIETASSVYFYGYETLISKDSFITEKNKNSFN